MYINNYHNYEAQYLQNIVYVHAAVFKYKKSVQHIKLSGF